MAVRSERQGRPQALATTDARCDKHKGCEGRRDGHESVSNDQMRKALCQLPLTTSRLKRRKYLKTSQRGAFGLDGYVDVRAKTRTKRKKTNETNEQHEGVAFGYAQPVVVPICPSCSY